MNPDFVHALEDLHRYAGGAARLERLSFEIAGHNTESSERDAAQIQRWSWEEAVKATEAKRKVRALFEAQEKELEALRLEVRQYQHELDARETQGVPV